MEEWYWYEAYEDGTVGLLRMFGTASQVDVPAKIQGKFVTRIGAYCFSENSKTREYFVAGNGEFSDLTGEEADTVFQKRLETGRIKPLGGMNITGVTLPDEVCALGNFAFYQCRELLEISVGKKLTEIGSDAFMNCRGLKRITVRGRIDESSGLKQILAQRTEETEVHFCPQNGTEAVLCYPEFSESYDLIGPAHIFELNIQGEGFRARQCFQNGVPDLGQYDKIFELECGQESVRTLCRMALFRLQYPVGLQEKSRKRYRDYLESNREKACEIYLKERDVTMLEVLGRLHLLEDRELEFCVRQAVSMEWAEGVRWLLDYRNTRNREEKEEYAFEDF